MAIEILLPKTDAAMSEGQVTAWKAREGETVTEGEPLFSVDADSATSEIEAPATGTLRIITRTGETYAVGTVLGYIE